MKFSVAIGLILLFSSFRLTNNGQPPVANTHTSPLAEYSDEWNDPKYEVCNTAANANYMTAREKEIIYILNLARMNPALFSSSVLETDSTSDNEYVASLIETMQNLKPRDVLQPNKESFVSAQCHAISSGRAGYVGHNRLSPNCKKVTHFYGECCSYGSSTALDIVLQLLIDDGVPSLGHRKICLDNLYTSVGVSVQPHKKYGTAAVLDFYY